MFRNRSGERDLDHIINAACWGMEHAMLEYPNVRAGLILMMDRRLTREQEHAKTEGIVMDAGLGIGVSLAVAAHCEERLYQQHTPIAAPLLDIEFDVTQ